jgi:hypothetical protein
MASIFRFGMLTAPPWEHLPEISAACDMEQNGLTPGAKNDILSLSHRKNFRFLINSRQANYGRHKN